MCIPLGIIVAKGTIYYAARNNHNNHQRTANFQDNSKIITILS